MFSEYYLQPKEGHIGCLISPCPDVEDVKLVIVNTHRKISLSFFCPPKFWRAEKEEKCKKNLFNPIDLSSFFSFVYSAYDAVVFFSTQCIDV